MIQVAAAIIRQNGKILICQRGEGGNCSLLWEFPGGKLEAGETLEECLIRECKEELSIHLEVEDIFAETTYRYGTKNFHFTFFNSKLINGTIKRTVHRDIKWVLPKELDEYEFCPADVDVVAKLST